jgi:hypothetical protein
VKRRHFIAGLSSAIGAWPFATRAQQPERMYRIGVLGGLAADDPEVPDRNGAFLKGLKHLAGSTAGMCRSSIAGVPVTTVFADMHRNWSRSKLAAQHKLPAIYYRRAFVTAGA